jgi:glycosyltransferase involved in cell wall biosynthesis
MTRLVFVVNNPDFLVSHRLVLVRGARAAGYDVHAITPNGPGQQVLRAEGVETHSWRLDRKGQGPLQEARSVASLVALYARLQPDIVHHVTIKPVLYGSLAARIVRRPAVVNAVSGFGYVFLAEGAVAEARRRAIAGAYRVALSTPRSVVVLQNDDDEADLRRAGALGAAEVVKIRGSGVDLTRFHVTPEPAGAPLVVLPARLLRDKGVEEFVQAARLVRATHPIVRFALVGGLDAGNPAGVSGAEVEAWTKEGAVEWWGHQTDMPKVFEQAMIVCLPSYREGMPKALLEAAAAGRALITTDAPGCRDAVDGGRSGLLIPVRDAGAIARAVVSLVEDSGRRLRLGLAARELAERRFDERAVLADHLRVYARFARP